MANTGYERRYDVQTVEDIETALLDTCDYEYKGRETDVELVYPEFTSVCPWSGLADFGEIRVRYIPNEKLVEMKSFKYYLHSFRNVGILQEHVVNRVLDDLVKLLDPIKMEVYGEFNARGGMATIATVRYEKK